MKVSTTRETHEKHAEALATHAGEDVLLTQIAEKPGQFTLRHGSTAEGGEEEGDEPRVNGEREVDDGVSEVGGMVIDPNGEQDGLSIRNNTHTRKQFMKTVHESIFNT